jgi:hypothetical protein
VPYAVDVYAWRNAIMSERGPGHSLGRLVLIAVSLHMKPDGTGAWPSQALIAQRALVGLRSVKRHLEIAERRGWVERAIVRIKGQQWRRTEYSACVPDDVYDALPARPWEEDPTWTRSATAAPIEVQQGARAAPNKPLAARDEVPITTRRGATETERGATGARRGANGDRNEVPELGLLTPPLNSSSNSSLNSSREGALKRTTRPTDAELREKIQSLRRGGFDDHDICKALAQHCLTHSELSRLESAA